MRLSDKGRNYAKLLIWLEGFTPRYYAIPDNWYAAINAEKERLGLPPMRKRPRIMKWLANRAPSTWRREGGL